MLNDKEINKIVQELKNEMAKGRDIAISPKKPLDCGGYFAPQHNTFITGYSFKDFKFYKNFSFDSKNNFYGALLTVKKIYEELGK